jgi:hypothetical protein
MESNSRHMLRQRIKPWLGRYIGDHFFLIFAVLFAIWVLRGVPQVYHVWQPRSIVGPSGVAYVSLLVLLGYLYITSAIKFLRPELRFGWWLMPAGFITGWLDALEQRIETIPPGPIVLVAASGGGSRAALFTSLILQMMKREPFPALPQLSPSVATDADPGTWADRIAIISSVSGGSLASARYAYSNYDAGATIDQLKYTTRSELIHESLDSLKAMRKDAQAYHSAARCGSEPDGDPRTAIVRRADCDMQQLIEGIEQLQQGVALSAANEAEDVIHAAFSSRLADEMSMDFMAPVLRGFITPSATRGNGLYHFWNHQFDWRDISQYASPYDTSRPLLLLNASDADTGQRVITGFPPIDKGFLPGALSPSPLGLGDTSGDFQPVALSDFSTAPIDLSLTRAVRLPSNFPFGFNVNEFSTSSQPPLVVADDATTSERSLRLMDGGVVDNSGIDSLYAIVESLSLHAQRNPEGREAILLNRIRGRGVIIVEIDSGAKPKRHVQGLGASLLSLPINGLSNASYTNALRNVARFQTQLGDALSFKHNDLLAASLFEPEATYTTRIKSRLSGQQLIAAVATMTPSLDPVAATPQILHFKFTCSRIEQENSAVMTAFALGPRDKAIVTNMFLIEMLNWRREVKEASKNYRAVVQHFANSDITAVVKSAYHQQLLQMSEQEMQALPERRKRLDNSALAEAEKRKLDRRSIHRSIIPLMAAQALDNPLQPDPQTPLASATPNAERSAQTNTTGMVESQRPGITANRDDQATAAFDADQRRQQSTSEVTFIEYPSIADLSAALRKDIARARSNDSSANRQSTLIPAIKLSKPIDNWQDIIKQKGKGNY